MRSRSDAVGCWAGRGVRCRHRRQSSAPPSPLNSHNNYFWRRQVMARIKCFAATLVFTACAANVPANNASADNTPKKTAPAALTKDALVALEKSAYEAWKSKDAKFWHAF